MCAIFGEVKVDHDAEWVKSQTEKALARGKDLICVESDDVKLYHTRLATNVSEDFYPIEIDGWEFAMNGIVGEKKYKELQSAMSGRTNYTVDSAFLMQLILDSEFKDWQRFDNDDYVFAFWMYKDKTLFLGAKDFPLSIEPFTDGLRFSSFKSENAESTVFNAVVELNLTTDLVTVHYEFKNLIYKILKPSEMLTGKK